MEAIEFNVDGGIFSIDVVSRAAHRYTAHYFVELATQMSHICVRMSAKSAESCAPDLRSMFENDLLDERLRERIRAETGELHVTLVRAALTEAVSSP